MVENHTHICSVCGRECSRSDRFKLFVHSVQAYRNKILIGSLLVVPLSLLVPAYARYSQLVAENQELKNGTNEVAILKKKLSDSQKNIETLESKLSDYEQNIKDMNKAKERLSSQVGELEKRDYKHLAFVYTPDSREIEPIHSNQTLSLKFKLSSDTRQDVHYIDVKQKDSQFQFALEGVSNEANVNMFIDELCRNNRPQTIAESKYNLINKKLQPGIYMVRIKSSGNDQSDYNLNITRN
ncbi:MAG: hypothetical protein F6K62_16505 [Sphaerospermopsis sp. SIO1G2]|nr:hypothetical protein [Sphaerospermopsis sp. SIO1G2]